MPKLAGTSGIRGERGKTKKEMDWELDDQMDRWTLDKHTDHPTAPQCINSFHDRVVSEWLMLSSGYNLLLYWNCKMNYNCIDLFYLRGLGSVTEQHPSFS
jgi:hypothetical protein